MLATPSKFLPQGTKWKIQLWL